MAYKLLKALMENHVCPIEGGGFRRIQNMFGFLKKEIHEPIELQRKDIMAYQEPVRSWILSGEDCNQVQGEYGTFGSLTNPIPANGSIGGIKNLGKLRGRTGAALFFHRITSTNSPVDIRWLKCLRVLNRSANTKIIMKPEEEHTVRVRQPLTLGEFLKVSDDGIYKKVGPS